MKALLTGLALCAAGLNAAWEPAWSAPGFEYSDWTQPLSPRPTESWERLALRHTPVPDIVPLPALLGADLLWLWQHTLSGKDGSHCPYYPSCSRYSRIAVENYGLVLGVLMTADRLERCHDQPNSHGQYELLHQGGEAMIFNPPRLDAWW